MRRTSIYGATLVILLTAFCAVGCNGGDAGDGGEAATAGETHAGGGHAAATAPAKSSADFVLASLDGSRVSLEDFRGDVVILDFWATWCGPCKRVMPHLQKIHDDYADEGIHVVALSVDRKGPRIVKSFIERYGYTFPVAMADESLQRAYGGISSIPATFIVGPDGKVVQQMVGAHSLADYLAAARRAKQS